MPAADRPRARTRTVQIRFTFASVALVLLALFAAVVLVNVLVAARRTIGWVVASGIIAVLVRPLVDRIARRVPLVLATVLVLLGLAGATAFLAYRYTDDLRREAQNLEAVLPDAAASLEERYEVASDFRLEERVNGWVDQLRERTKGDPRGAVSTVSTYVLCAILLMFLLLYAPRVADGVLRQLPPDRAARYRGEITRTLRVGGSYLGWTFAQGLAVGALVWVLLRITDVPAAVPLAVIAGLLGMVPTIGILVGGAPALLLAIASRPGVLAGVVVAIALVVLQAVEIVVVRPRVTRRSLYVGPAVPAIAALVGWEMYGTGGAVYAAAIVVFLLAFLDAAAQPDGPEEAAA